MVRYLLQEFERPDLSVGSRLPTNRELARQLGVSLPTVQVAIRGLAQEGRIRTRLGSGTFLVSKSTKPSTRLRLALSVPLAKQGAGGVWAYDIASSIFQATFESTPPATLIPLPSQTEATDAAKGKLLAERFDVDGLILFPYSLYPESVRDEVCKAYEQAGKPVVCVLPPTDTATTNFVSLDYYGTSFRIAQAWKQTGRRRFLLLHSHPLQASISARLRCAGFLSGLADGLGFDRTVRVAKAGTEDGEEAGRELMNRLLSDGHEPPDAVFCLGDLLAMGAVEALTERGFTVPEDVSVVGVGLGLGSRAPHNRPTGIYQPLHLMGPELLRMITARIERKGESFPGVVLPTPIIGGSTTRAVENELLGLDPVPAPGRA